MLHIVRELGFPHLTNWGPMTKNIEADSAQFISLCYMSLEKRKRLEAIASQEPVAVPDGKWNCQDWIVSVLEKASQLDIIAAEDIKTSIAQASVA
jgi:hypothetical protein